jgi:hypothetical protein
MMLATGKIMIGKTFWLSLGCVAIGVTGWVLLISVAMAFEGGHPPLSAYVAFPVIVISVVFNSTGGAIGLHGIYRRGNTSVAMIATTIVNFSLVAVSALTLLRMLL